MDHRSGTIVKSCPMGRSPSSRGAYLTPSAVPSIMTAVCCWPAYALAADDPVSREQLARQLASDLWLQIDARQVDDAHPIE
jgi:hypothetical protein